ncbi:DUF6318 family protein [Kribbella sp. NPDC054772]
MSALPTTAPQRPAAATGLAIPAAKVFLAHYVDLMNYAYATGDAEPMLSASDKGCIGCNGIAGYVGRINVKNGAVEGDYKDRLVSVKDIFRGKSGRLGGKAIVKSGNFTERSSPGASPVPQGNSTGTMEFTLAPNGSNWVIYELEIKE